VGKKSGRGVAVRRPERLSGAKKTVLKIKLVRDKKIGDERGSSEEGGAGVLGAR
jgi:hypothetical protein